MFTHLSFVETLPNGGRQATDLPSRLLESRILVLNKEIDSNAAMALATSLLLLERQDPEGEVVLLIDSPGGSVYAALGLLSIMRDVSCPVHTYCVGLAASAAALVLACGDRRSAYEHATVMIHQPLTGTGLTQQSNVRIVAEHSTALRERLDSILAAATGKAKAVITADTERDHYLSAEEAMRYGIVDEVIPFRM